MPTPNNKQNKTNKKTHNKRCSSLAATAASTTTPACAAGAWCGRGGGIRSMLCSVGCRGASLTHHLTHSRDLTHSLPLSLADSLLPSFSNSATSNPRFVHFSKRPRRSLKANDGYLYLLEKSFFFLKKPIVHVKHTEVRACVISCLCACVCYLVLALSRAG
jgi:hypothetical protein